MKRKGPVFTENPIGRTMFHTALTMLPGTLAISGYNLADTWFVSRTEDWRNLAAMGYSFPLVMLLSFLFSGFATGIMVTSSQAMGARRYLKMSHLISAGLVYSFLVSLVCGLLGYFTIDVTFNALGAGKDVMPAINSYMTLWYLAGAPTAALAMTGNNILMATGSTRTAGLMMLSGLVLNIVLDPIFIFGWFGCPVMGIGGAALATVLSQLASATVMISMFALRYRYLTLRIFRAVILKRTAVRILRFAIPAILGMLLIPLGNTIITAIIARFGDAAVAAASTAGRIEVIAFVFPMSLGMALMPMVGQNYGAKLYERINQCRRIAMRSALVLLGITGTLFAIFAPQLSGIFTTDPTIFPIMVAYLRIIAPFFCLVEIHRFATFFFTGCDHPIAAALLNAMRIFGFMVPFSFLALWCDQLYGVFWARSAADLLSGLIALWLVRRLTHRFFEKKLGKKLY